uniref:Carboxylic ester hydrolase n=1 Tax=Pardosa pseudoannulata TaxID=330961 RepID=A0A1B1FIW2_9ARAC|nr:AChE4 [Pardosa pseudoannulata]
MLRYITLLFLLSLWSYFYPCPSLLSGPVVTTPSGRVEGTTQSHNGVSVGAFLGIPFARPPVGDLRFRRPRAPASWEGTLSAREMRPGCVQFTRNPFPWRDVPPGLDEDCLYLNVWVPATPLSVLSRKTVMFWVYGGAFVFGSSRVDFYDGRVLAVEGDVIVVTVNYRLGPFGFLYSGNEDAPGNMGLLDLVEALKWVRGNIASFGGDPDSITLFGQSAGGIAIGMFCVSPLTRGMFRRVILQSGSPANLDGEDNNLDFRMSQRLAEAVGCAEDENSLADDPERVVECLRNVDVFELSRTFSALGGNTSRLTYPRFGDELLPQNPRKAIANGVFGAVDVLIGTNSGDGALIITNSMTEVFGFFGEKDPQINRTFGTSIIKKQFQEFVAPCSVVNQYLGGVNDDDFNAIRQQVFMATGDYERTCPATYFAESFAKKGVRAYYYFFTHRPSPSPFAPWMLASHFDETPFVFGYPLRYRRNYTLRERTLSRRMIQAWTAFAKTGIPIGAIWPRYSRENPRYQILDVNSLDTGMGPRQNNCDFFRPFFGF